MASRIKRTTRLLDCPASFDCSAGEFWFMFGIDVDLPWEYFMCKQVTFFLSTMVFLIRRQTVVSVTR